MEKNVLLVNPTIQPIGVNLLKKECKVFMAPDGEERTLIEHINKNNIDAIITRVEKVTRKVIESCKSLKVIGQNGVGLDNIDVEAATESGVMVLNVPDANYISVAEHTIMFILGLSRSLIMADKNVKKGNWKFRETNIPMEVSDKNLLILGLGRIGKDVAKKAKALDMNVMAYDSYVKEEDMNLIGVKKVDLLIDGLKDADFVSVHTPLTEVTRGMISYKEFEAMKTTAYIINMGRGPVIDETALYDALSNNKIAGAGLDVFEKEPPNSTNPLFEFENLISTPHFGGDTIEAKRRCAYIIADTVIKALKGKKTYNCFNKNELKYNN